MGSIFLWSWLNLQWFSITTLLQSNLIKVLKSRCQTKTTTYFTLDTMGPKLHLHHTVPSFYPCKFQKFPRGPLSIPLSPTLCQMKKAARFFYFFKIYSAPKTSRTFQMIFIISFITSIYLFRHCFSGYRHLPTL
jgi:hypothetical protein